jgi:dihydrofolate synthase/folylpolyglutamate synthase
MGFSYAGALDFLFPRVTTIKFGLDTTRALLSALGEPQRAFPSIHVGGTNGKGSVATLVAAALHARGLRVGLYTSPHLVSFRERIRVDGEPISEAAVADLTSHLEPAIRAHEATFFEATTAIAFADFAMRGVDIAVVEVGLGGRLDSTNVLHPLVSAVTKIDFDHQKFLGDTLDAIAREKAGIAKPGVPFVVGEERAAIVEVLRAAADDYVAAVEPGARADVRVVEAGRTWTGALGLLGPHQRRNAAVADAILGALPPSFRPTAEQQAYGFVRARIPGRCDRQGKWFFDVAHNPDGIRALIATLEKLQPPRPVHGLVAILGDKAWPEMLAELTPHVDQGVLTVAPTAAGRRWDIGELQAWRAGGGPERARWTVVPVFAEAVRAAEAGAGTVLVTGSFHTVGDVMFHVGLAPIQGR